MIRLEYDLEPLVTLATKQRVFPRALRANWWIVFEHDARQPLGRLEEHEGRLRARPLEVEA